MKRNPADRWQQRVAWHEIGHALVGAALGLRIGRVVHTVASGYTHLYVRDHQWREYAVVCMAGSEAEKLWEKYHNGWFGSRSHCRGDYALFRQAIRGRDFSESQARAQARKILRRNIARLDALAPQLITAGHLTGKQL